MKKLALLAIAAATAGITVAFAQLPVRPPGRGRHYGGYPGGAVGYRASTAAEGRLRGMADVVRSAGQANLDNSAAAINYSEARRNQIDNRRAWTETYFEMRRTNKAYRDAARTPRASMEDLVRYAQAGKPKQLSPGELDPVSGSINWPILLRTDGFADDRAKLEATFGRRASHSAIDPETYMTIKQTTEDMLADLKAQIRKVPADQYMVAKRFLESLAFEASQPAT